jgi:ABC-type uncharacterized transport system permease subunit
LRGMASYNYLIEMIPYVVTIIGLVFYAMSIKRKARRHQLKPIKEKLS